MDEIGGGERSLDRIKLRTEWLGNTYVVQVFRRMASIMGTIYVLVVGMKRGVSEGSRVRVVGCEGFTTKAN